MRLFYPTEKGDAFPRLEKRALFHKIYHGIGVSLEFPALGDVTDRETSLDKHELHPLHYGYIITGSTSGNHFEADYPYLSEAESILIVFAIIRQFWVDKMRTKLAWELNNWGLPRQNEHMTGISVRTPQGPKFTNTELGTVGLSPHGL
ncbi:hypothetical protein TNCV_5020651 [Trichonephila clavipes]|nr:hypothetical protein TNCV_5020651 [Trichonephila clavipes]